MSCVASIRFSARWIGSPVIVGQVLRALLARSPAGAFSPVPIAVAPMLTSHSTRWIASSALHFARQRRRERLELLAERHRHGVLELRAAHLQDVGELLALGAERGDQLVDRGDELRVAERHADVQRRRIGVVGGLRAVDVIVRIAVLVLALLVAHQLERAVGDHLVGVHVGRRAGAALEARRAGTGRAACRR